MKPIIKSYVEELYKTFSYLGAWLPNVNLRLGDVGVRDGAEFKRLTTLKDLGVPFTVRKGANKGNLNHTSQTGVSLQAQGSVEATGPGMASPAGGTVSIQFSREGAVLFQASDCVEDEIEDKVSLGKAVLDLFRSKKWEANWVVIDTLVSAKTATIFVANSGSAGLELAAKIPVQVTDLANLDAGLTVTSQSGQLFSFIAAQGLKPLFRVSRIKKPFLRAFGPIRFGGPSICPADPEGGVMESVSPLED